MIIGYIVKPEENCKRSVVDFYEMIAREIGYEVTANTHYNPTKIQVSEDIASEMEDFCIEGGMDRMSFGMMWCCSGPGLLPDGERNVKVDVGFAYEKEDEDEKS